LYYACTGVLVMLYSFPTRRSSDLVPCCGLVSFCQEGSTLAACAAQDRLLVGAHIADCSPIPPAGVRQCHRNNRLRARFPRLGSPDRKSTRLNSSHVKISYAVFCLK